MTFDRCLFPGRGNKRSLGLAGKIDSWPAITFIVYSKSGPQGRGWESIRCVLRNGQGGSLTLLDNPESILSCDVIGGRTLSRFPERMPRFSLQSRNDNELARNRNSVLRSYGTEPISSTRCTSNRSPLSTGYFASASQAMDSQGFCRALTLRENAGVRYFRERERRKIQEEEEIRAWRAALHGS